VPAHLRNAPTRLMKTLGYGKGYEYAHDAADAITGMDCLPERLLGRRYYQPTTRGFEKTLGDRLGKWAELKRQRKATPGGLNPDRARAEEPE
jgi:putative ATPase